ncbi:MAG: glycogen synthase GlgA [Candidatus Omnitrophica bacterium]|nr:glycogen synthase GlgA [Candidatus Omnitrophota bacterium]
MSKKPQLKVLFASSEVFPFAKTGGLADVSSALPKALTLLGCQVAVCMPMYKNIVADDLKIVNSSDRVSYAHCSRSGVDYYFIIHDDFFKRSGIYGEANLDYTDNLDRFSFFSQAVLELAKELNFSPDIVHINDWQTCLVAVYLKTLYAKDGFLNRAKTILTIHNLAYQGIFERNQFKSIGLPQTYFSQNCFEFYGKINLLKAGIIFSDIVNTVSPSYAREIQTKRHGCGLEGVLRNRKADLYGVINAIDYDIWNPAADNFIYKKYSKDKLANKAVNKALIQKELNLKVDSKETLFGMVTRLAEQKGLDILITSLARELNRIQLIIIGVGEVLYHEKLKRLAEKFPHRFSFNETYNEDLAHKVYAASDFFLMPSRFEPCGLSQMISYKYATIPLVHHTGGLIDTVADIESSGGGIVFKKYDSKSLSFAFERSLALSGNKNEILKIRQKIAGYNFSWQKTAKEYLELYKKAERLEVSL